MLSRINIYTANMTPKQKRDLLGIYLDYLHYIQGLELVLKNNTIDYLAYMFMQRVDWDAEAIKKLPWRLSWLDAKEKDKYIRFAQGDIGGSEKYTYISLYHTKTEDDVTYPKIRAYPETHGYTNIDLNLPSSVERYSVAFPQGQKMKDAVFFIDGVFRVEYKNGRYGDMTVIDALNDQKVQDEFRILLSLADYYNKHKYEIEYNQEDSAKYMTKIMKKIMATEVLSSFENKVLELLGSYSDKTQDVLRTYFPNKTSQEVWQKAEKENLIQDAEAMQHYMNIRQLMRHQWDMLDGTGRFALGGNKKNDELRQEYLQSYHLIFDKTLTERIKAYQKVAMNMQTFLKIVYPEFLTRDQGESNSKFVYRLKEWQKQNPSLQPMVSTNYPLHSDKQKALVNNLRKVVPQAKVLDYMQESDLANFSEIENGYSHRAWFLKLYDHLESDMLDYCFIRGQLLNRKEMWNYFEKKVLSPEEYNIWVQYRQLRNNLSHNYLSEELRETLNNVVNGDFSTNVNRLYEHLSQNTPVCDRQEDGTYIITNKDGSVAHIDLKKRVVLSYVDKKGRNLLKKQKFNAEASENAAISPVKIFWKDKEIVDCKLPDGIQIDLRRKKVIFPDETRLYLDAKKYNVLCLENNSKVFTDKAFVITNFLDRGRKISIGRQESLFVAPKVRISTDKKGGLSDVCITLFEKQKMVTQFKNDDGAKIIFPDGTVLKDLAGKLVVSHNGIDLDYNHRHAFIRSYITSVPSIEKSSFER